MYRVVQFFTDLQDKGYAYREGDTYPREGLTPSKERIAELSSPSNRRGVKLIEEVEETAEKPEKADSDGDKKAVKTRKKITKEG
jgi:hypothetical protein